MPNRKVVLDETKTGSVLVGVSREGCDPIITPVEGGLEEALAAVLPLFEAAEEKWLVATRFPAHTPPPTPPKATRPATPAAPAADLPLLATEPETVEEKVPEVMRPVDAESGPAEPAVREPTEEARQHDEAVHARLAEAERSKSPAPVKPAEVPPIKEVPDGPVSKAVATEEYVLEDGRGPYGTVQEALDALGLPKDKRPNHNRWDRLSVELKKKIERRRRVSQGGPK